MNKGNFGLLPNQSFYASPCELDCVAKVRDLEAASKSISVFLVMVDGDIEANCVRTAGSHTRNLLGVKRGIVMFNVLFEHIISSEGNSLKGPASKAYVQVFSPYHAWAIIKAVAAGMLPFLLRPAAG
ncbi:Accelerated cell death 11 [Striga hermonthica]|uniref:Accelerated cell death 11 n=1 Tax=Striga hermonthica TaxID=68872 RepID=A0A9N7RFT5_STRHE|nr:Accelerated cell death 11 [Striga hermonthica]